MNWATVCILLTSVLPAHAAPREMGGVVGANEIASARDAWRQATEALGEDHPVTALMLRNLALAMQQGGYSNYAEHYALQALATLQRHFGASDVTLVPVLNVLTEAAVSEGRYAQAREYATRAVAIGPDAGAHFATALHNLAAAFQAEGELTEAAGYFAQALAARQEFLPPDHPYIRLTRAALQHLQRSAKLLAHR
jgi:tetratricopeptide (TPR) repeat protein